ncbi:MAG: DUF1614 domain-containing protein [candidate division WOR-3 bacterium]
MFFLPFSAIIFIIFVLLLPIIFVLFSVGAVGVAFQKLGMSPQTGLTFFLLSLFGGMINIPIKKKSVELPLEELEINSWYRFFFGVKPQFLQQQVLAINVGGCVLPVILCLYLFPKVPFLPTFFGILVMSAIAKLIARPTPGIGIAIPAFIPPIVSAILALLLARDKAAPVAYIIGVMGVLIGADLLNIKIIQKFGRGVMSIGGAGVFDGIYLVGIIAVLIT